MFNVGGGEIIVILLLALLLLGPEKLPETARKVGKVLAEVRRVTSGFEEEIRSAMDINPNVTQPNDAVHRTSEGPRLVGPVEGVAIAPAETPVPAAPSSGSNAFVADLGDDAATDVEDGSAS